MSQLVTFKVKVRTFDDEVFVTLSIARLLPAAKFSSVAFRLNHDEGSSSILDYTTSRQIKCLSVRHILDVFVEALGNEVVTFFIETFLEDRLDRGALLPFRPEPRYRLLALRSLGNLRYP